MSRPIDAYALNNALVSWYNDTEDGKEAHTFNILKI